MPKNKNTLSKLPEMMWLATAVLSLVVAVHKTINFGFISSWYFYGFVLLAGGIYYFRRNMRKN